jgi:hypothetical protein
MRRLILLAAVAALFLVALPVASAVAAPPEQVTFEGPAYFAGPDAGTGLFTASGPAVDSGAMCDAGDVVDIYTKAAPMTGQSPNGVNLQILKEFTCDDGSGSFQAELQVRIDFLKWPTFNWVVKGGTGDYVKLKGNGSGFGAFPLFNGDPDPIGVYDVYEGKLH